MSEKKLTESIEDDRGVLARRDGSGLPARRGALAHVSAEQISLADKIFIDGLEVFANHGVYEEENKLGQKFVVSATLYCDTRRAGQTDDLDASIDYGAVCHDIDGFLRDHTFKLVERMAESLAERLLDGYAQLLGVRLRIEKPWAPVGLPLRSVGVEIERLR